MNYKQQPQLTVKNRIKPHYQAFSSSHVFKVIVVLLSLFLFVLTGCNERPQSTGTNIIDTNTKPIYGISNQEAQAMVSDSKITSTHPSFISKQELNSILASSSPKKLQSSGSVVCAVMPHHLVAGRLIADAFSLIAKQEPSSVILVGPNHTNQGGRIITGLSGWQTPEGIVPAEEKAVKHLLDQGTAQRDEDVLSREHSIGALVPLLKHFLPEAEVIPIILHHGVSLQEVNKLISVLEPVLDEKTVLISSVDFSHYLTRSEAQLKDQETIRHMRNFDYPTLFNLGDDYLDSPASLTVAFRLAEKRGLKKFDVLDNTNSGIILQNDFIETTSYFTIIFQH